MSTTSPIINNYNPDLIFLATKTFHLDQVLKELEDVYRPGIKIISTQNGLGTEDLIADKFGADAALRMSLNYGVATPFFIAMTNLVKAIEDNYLER